MGFLKSLIAKIGAAEEKPIVRVRGLCSWSRRLTVFVPRGEHPSLHSILLVDMGKAEFLLHPEQDSSWTVKLRDNIISKHSSKDEALAMLDLIANALAPSKWRYARRFLAAWLVFYIFFPSQNQVQQTSFDDNRSTQSVAPYIAQQVERPSFVAPIPQNLPAPAPVSAPVSAINDPFGLQITPDGK